MTANGIVPPGSSETRSPASRRTVARAPRGPCGRRAAEQRDEVAAFQLKKLHSVPCSQSRIAEYRIGEEQSGGVGTTVQPGSPRACRRSLASGTFGLSSISFSFLAFCRESGSIAACPVKISR
jgi:hypothetical protein